jgi:hypothetical protein
MKRVPWYHAAGEAIAIVVLVALILLIASIER